jgi:hypothetical protein
MFSYVFIWLIFKYYIKNIKKLLKNLLTYVLYHVTIDLSNEREVIKYV